MMCRGVVVDCVFDNKRPFICVLTMKINKATNDTELSDGKFERFLLKLH